MQEGSGPCKIPNLSHLLRSYGTHVLTCDEVNSFFICNHLFVFTCIIANLMQLLL